MTFSRTTIRIALIYTSLKLYTHASEVLSIWRLTTCTPSKIIRGMIMNTYYHGVGMRLAFGIRRLHHTTSRARQVDRLNLRYRSLACICRARSVANCTSAGFDRGCAIYLRYLGANIPISESGTDYRTACPDIYALTTRVMPLSAASFDLTREKLAASGISDMLLFMPYSHFKDTRLQRIYSVRPISGFRYMQSCWRPNFACFVFLFTGGLGVGLWSPGRVTTSSI
ncbi:hypothetical protein BKA82DRAFT_545548 [Pisolithus tinctorius]|uniref:Uncharacterized protein n=1 Tax=Pisolithus tinctorius Marx 270 TaxID=870435 RepID=A0A0C3NB56_PISTI|nr:hypothetical protein BKA82DRAFT_545548 [Pisolithus tinctorius]KIN93130.1 hypothetical protein M404DRAFT_545548 [Pisolithus tinctorius Marx 270]